MDGACSKPCILVVWSQTYMVRQSGIVWFMRSSKQPKVTDNCRKLPQESERCAHVSVLSL